MIGREEEIQEKREGGRGGRKFDVGRERRPGPATWPHAGRSSCRCPATAAEESAAAAAAAESSASQLGDGAASMTSDTEEEDSGVPASPCGWVRGDTSSAYIF